jgi:hypothetical protein
MTSKLYLASWEWDCRGDNVFFNAGVLDTFHTPKEL